MAQRTPNAYARMRVQIVAVLLAYGLLPLCAMGVAGYVANQETTQSRTRNVLEAMIKNRKVTVEFFLEETMRQLAMIAATMPVSELSRTAVLATLTDQARRERSAFVDLGLIGEDGAHVAYVGPYKLAAVDYSDEPWFKEAMLRGRYESDIFLGFRRFPHMVMAVKKQEDGRDWILRATIDTDLLSALVREGELESGADVFVLNRLGEYQTSYADEHTLMARADTGSIPRHSGVRVVPGSRNGHQELVATTWLRGESWVLVARQQLPGLRGVLLAHPALMAVFVLGLVLVPPLSWLIARARLRQFRALELERAALYGSVAQSQKMAAVGRLAAGVAHEINNPLAIIDAQVGVLADTVDDWPEGEARTEFAERIKKVQTQVERGRKVTHRLLGFSRRVGPELEPVNVHAALDETVSFLEKELDASQVRIRREYAVDTPVIRSSLSQMQQVFLNLINNAIDALDGDGEVRLGARAHDGGVEVTIADDGPGIEPKELERIFEPFYSTKGGGERPHGGLGLAICQELMRQLGGRIAVRSAVGEGTVFVLWFPREPADG